MRKILVVDERLKPQPKVVKRKLNSVMDDHAARYSRSLKRPACGQIKPQPAVVTKGPGGCAHVCHRAAVIGTVQKG